MPKTVRAFGSILLLLCGLTTNFAGAAEISQTDANVRATKAAITWLKLVDQGEYAASWQTASSFFKARVTEAQWTQQVSSVRGALGLLISRKIKSAKYATTLPGAPDGHYVVIQYSTSFEHKQSAVETVTPMLDNDGDWRVSGYYIE